MSIKPPKTFDLKACADTIRANLKGEMAHRIAIGRELEKAKAHLGHGNFGPWLNAQFKMTTRTAQRYMSAAKLAGKNDTVSQLPATAVYALAAQKTSNAIPPKAAPTTVKKEEHDERHGNAISALEILFSALSSEARILEFFAHYDAAGVDFDLELRASVEDFKAAVQAA